MSGVRVTLTRFQAELLQLAAEDLADRLGRCAQSADRESEAWAAIARRARSALAYDARPKVKRNESRKGKPMKIYVASSWRNLLQPGIVLALRRAGHEVYDFRRPDPEQPEAGGFSWAEIDPNWQAWEPKVYREALQHPIAARGYAFDIGALKACDACVLVLPSGRSASWEFGYAMGQGKRGAVVMFDQAEPELMYREAEIITSLADLFDHFGDPIG